MQALANFRHLILLASVLAFLPAAPAGAACTNPAGNEKDVTYNIDYHTYQFCNGTQWKAMTGLVITSQVAPPAGSGYFVMSHDTYNANLGGRAGADAKCLSDLTTNTGWKGYATANSNGQLVASKVKAWLCDSTACTDLMPLTTYYFANANDATAGGGSFTTDNSSHGPGDTNSWAAANYFSGSFNYWTGRSAGSNTTWGTFDNSTFNNHCISWTNSAGATGWAGVSTNTTSSRWNNSMNTCSNTYNLICYVNP